MILDRTLVRRIENQYYDVDALVWQQNMNMSHASGQALEFIVDKKQLPNPIPAHWQVTEQEGKQVKVVFNGELNVIRANIINHAFTPVGYKWRYWAPVTPLTPSAFPGRPSRTR